MERRQRLIIFIALIHLISLTALGCGGGGSAPAFPADGVLDPALVATWIGTSYTEGGIITPLSPGDATLTVVVDGTYSLLTPDCIETGIWTTKVSTMFTLVSSAVYAGGSGCKKVPGEITPMAYTISGNNITLSGSGFVLQAIR